jgi:hypothetical protein
MVREDDIVPMHYSAFLHTGLYCTRMISKVTRSVSEGGQALPRSRFGLLGWD